jgi:hypothetical protein
MVSLRRVAHAPGMHRTRRDAPLLGHVRLAMSRFDERRIETAHATRGPDGRARLDEIARWEKEGGAVQDRRMRKQPIGIHDASSQ